MVQAYRQPHSCRERGPASRTKCSTNARCTALSQRTREGTHNVMLAGSAETVVHCVSLQQQYCSPHVYRVWQYTPLPVLDKNSNTQKNYTAPCTTCHYLLESAKKRRSLIKTSEKCNEPPTLEGLYIMPPLSLGDMQKTPISNECASLTLSKLPSLPPGSWLVPDAVYDPTN